MRSVNLTGRRSTRLFAAAALLVGYGSLLSCVSERATGAAVDPAACSFDLQSEAFGSTIVIIRNFAFSPNLVSVKQGTKVTWVNCETTVVSHTSTSDAGVWTTTLIAPGESKTVTFASPGTFPYHCNPHPGMRASVVVD